MKEGRKEKIIKDFGKSLKNIRKSKGLSFRELASASGVDHAQIARIEKGETDPRMHTVVLLADALEIDPGELFSFPR